MRISRETRPGIWIAPVSSRMRMREVVLPQQVFPVVVSIRRSNDTVNVLLRRLVGIGYVLSQVRGALMIEFDQNDRALHAVVKDTVSF